jgi:predicted secreted protein
LIKKRILYVKQVATVICIVRTDYCCCYGVTKSGFAALNRKLFEANTVAEALKNLPEKEPQEPSNRLLIDVPEVSLDAERIPIRIRSELPGTDMMLLMAATVVPPAIAQFTIPVGTEAEIQTQIRERNDQCN